MPTELPPYLVYLHGFNSSPASFKAQYLDDFLTRQGWQEYYSIPKLDYRPAKAIAQLREIIESRLTNYRITLIGSSLGGYYATYLTEHYGLMEGNGLTERCGLTERYEVNSVLINPAVSPYRMMAANLGRHANYYTDEEYMITQDEVEQLRQLEVRELSHPERYLVLLQTADETLDYRDAARKYQQCQLTIQEGGSHGFDQFDRVVPAIMAFSGLATFRT